MMIVNDHCDSRICHKQYMVILEELLEASKSYDIYENPKQILAKYRKCSTCEIYWSPSILRCPCCKRRIRGSLKEKEKIKQKRVYY